ncbi:MAG: acyl-CoA dehydrogenase C-terminal domain-containing protein, partial [Nitratireductor sp.]
SNGQCFASYLDELRKDVELLQEEQNLQEICSQLIEALSLVEETGEWLLLKIKAGEFEEALSGATPFLQLMGLAIGAVYLAKLGAYKKTSNQDEQAINEQLNLASYFAQNHLPECAALKNTILHGAPSLLDAMQTLKTST